MKKNLFNTVLIGSLYLTSSVTLATPIITDGLIGAWDFSGNANDTSSNNNHGAVHGATLTTDRFGNSDSAYFFNGSNSYIEIGSPIPSELQPSNAFTISTWVNASAYANSNGGVVGGIVASQWDGTQSGYSVQIDYRNSAHGGTLGGVHFQVGGGGYWTSPNEGTTDTAIGLNQWSHIVAVAEVNANYKVYMDAVLIADWIPQNAISYSDLEHLLIGSNLQNGDNNRQFSGSIDDIAIYDRALSSLEVTSLYNAPAPTEVPSPTTLLLLGIGLIGLSSRKKHLT